MTLSALMIFDWYYVRLHIVMSQCRSPWRPMNHRKTRRLEIRNGNQSMATGQYHCSIHLLNCIHLTHRHEYTTFFAATTAVVRNVARTRHEMCAPSSFSFSWIVSPSNAIKMSYIICNRVSSCSCVVHRSYFIVHIQNYVEIQSNAA